MPPTRPHHHRARLGLLATLLAPGLLRAQATTDPAPRAETAQAPRAEPAQAPRAEPAPPAPESAANAASKAAVISLVGDEIHVVRYRGQTGSRALPTVEETFPGLDPALDRFAIAAAVRVLRERQPAMAVVEVVPPAAGSDADPARLLADGRPVAANPTFAALRSAGFTHALVIGKHRALASLRLAHASSGSGWLSGLGFYLDPALKVRRADTGEVGTGFIAPYVYVQLSWIDLATLAVLGQEPITASSSRSAARNPDGVDVWGAMSTPEKVAALRGLLRRGIEEALPKVLERR